MDKFDTIQGKLFYTVYCMHKSNEITNYQRGRIKDMIVQWDPQIQEIIRNPNRLKQNLLEMACAYRDYGNHQFYTRTTKTLNKLKQLRGDKAILNYQANHIVHYHRHWIKENSYYSEFRYSSQCLYID